jgi:hypothetical protein
MSFPHPSNARLASVDRHRPRLSASTDATGVVPYFRAAPPPPAPVPTEREALVARIDAALATARAAFHSDRRQRPQLMLVGHNELAQINADLEAVRALNATLSHQSRSREFAGWPSPVFRQTRLHAWRDLLHALELASRILSAAEAHEKTWFYSHA